MGQLCNASRSTADTQFPDVIISKFSNFIMDRFPAYQIHRRGIFLTVMASIIDINSKSNANIYGWFDNITKRSAMIDHNECEMEKDIKINDEIAVTTEKQKDKDKEKEKEKSKDKEKNGASPEKTEMEKIYKSFWDVQDVLCDPESIGKGKDCDKIFLSFQDSLEYLLKQFKNHPVSNDVARVHFKVCHELCLKVGVLILYLFGSLGVWEKGLPDEI